MLRQPGERCLSPEALLPCRHEPGEQVHAERRAQQREQQNQEAGPPQRLDSRRRKVVGGTRQRVAAANGWQDERQTKRDRSARVSSEGPACDVSQWRSGGPRQRPNVSAHTRDEPPTRSRRPQCLRQSRRRERRCPTRNQALDERGSRRIRSGRAATTVATSSGLACPVQPPARQWP